MEFFCVVIVSFNLRLVCQQMELGVQAIFGPSDQLLGSHIQSICEALALPHIETRIDFETQPKKFSINLHPSQQHINNAYKDLMVYLNWTKVAIIYEEDYGSYFEIHSKMQITIYKNVPCVYVCVMCMCAFALQDFIFSICIFIVSGLRCIHVDAKRK